MSRSKADMRPACLALARLQFRFGLNTLAAALAAHHALADLPDRHHVLRQLQSGRVQVPFPAAIIVINRLLRDE